MISIRDEQIKQALEAAGVEFQYFTHARTNAQMCTTEGSISFDLIANGVRALIALAQEVKPLDFKRLHGAVFAHTEIGDYEIFHTSDDVDGKPDGDGYYYELANSGGLETYTTEAEAIEAANADFRMRVLGCLVNGGV